MVGQAIEEESLEEWIKDTEVRRDELVSFAVSRIPADVGERHEDVDKALSAADDAGRLLADAEKFLAHSRAQEMFDAMERYSDLTAKEREIVIKDRVRLLQRVVDGLAVTTKTLRDRLYLTMNINRSR